MTGKWRLARKYHLTCYHQSRLNKGPCLLFNASCLEYVGAGFIRFFVVTLYPSYHQPITETTSMADSYLVGQCLSNVTTKPQQDPRQMFHSLDSWRKSLPVKMHMNENIGTDVYYLAMQAMGYRFECILCRLIRRCWQQTHHADWSEWVKQRLRSAILELDTITKRVLASGTLQDFPISLYVPSILFSPFPDLQSAKIWISNDRLTSITTIIALLALHIESALDTAETDLVRSMAQISISQTMLVLTQGKEIPALKRALPLFEEILAKKNLYLIPPNSVGQVQDNTMVDADASLHTQVEQYENNPLLYDDFLGFDLLDEWQIGQMDFTGSG